MACYHGRSDYSVRATCSKTNDELRQVIWTPVACRISHTLRMNALSVAVSDQLGAVQADHVRDGPDL